MRMDSREEEIKSLPIVTVCIPSYNHQEFVGEAISSVINQTYPNIELIVIDDGSDDKSYSILKSREEDIKKRFLRYKIQKQENKGLPATLNGALKWARGAYFVMLSSDDRMLPEKTYKQVKFMEENKEIAGVFGGIRKIDENGSIIKSCEPTSGIWAFDDILLKKCQLFAPTMMLRRTELDDVNGYWEDVALEDRAITLKITSQNKKIATIKGIVAEYRWHQRNTIRKSRSMLLARLKIYRKFPESESVKVARVRAHYGYCLETYAREIDRAIKHFKVVSGYYNKELFKRSGRRVIKKLLLFKLFCFIKGVNHG